jgi:hypothetical protein
LAEREEDGGLIVLEVAVPLEMLFFVMLCLEEVVPVFLLSELTVIFG